MKKIIVLLVTGIQLLYSCTKDKHINCAVSPVPLDYKKEANSLISVNTQNFWLYTDSVFNTETGGVEHVESTPINIKSVFAINNITYFEFSELLPPMTLTGDTLCTVVTKSSDNCYDLRKMLFAVTDTVVLEAGKMLYPDNNRIETAAGEFSGNIVYDEDNVFRMYFHPGIGLIRLELRAAGSSNMRRSLTLKEYKLK